jgi:membrane protease YdiL (CAAX protease family)
LPPLTIGVALLLFPLLGYLIPNPVSFLWGFKHGSAPMPPEVARRADSIDRYMLFLFHAVLVAALLLLMRRHSVSASKVGLRPDHWQFYLLIGCAAGVAWAGFTRILLWFGPRSPRRALDESKAPIFARGPAVLWILRFLVGAFAEEFWRAFCLFALKSRGHSLPLAVIITALAFGAGHLSLGVWGALGVATFGIAAALLFLLTGSLLVTYPAHFIVNVCGMYWVRRARREAGA